MDEVVPREVVEVAIAAGQEETRRNGIGIFRGLVTLGATAPLVDEAGSLRAEAVFLDLEQPRVEGRQQAAFHAAHPARERTDGDADVRLRRPRIDEFALLERWHAQVLHLRAENLADGGEQARLGDGLAAILFPLVDAQRHHREARQIDQRARPVCPEQLTGADFPDGCSIGGHGQSSSFGTGRGFHPWSSEMCPVFMIRRTPGSTSRIDIGTVQLSHAWMPGDLTSPTIVAACAPRFS